MAKLSRRTWNNIIIIVVSIMIILFQLMGPNKEPLDDGLSPATISQHRLLPPHAQIVSLTLPDITIEKQQQQWQSTPLFSPLIPFVDVWQQISLPEWPDDMSAERTEMITVQIASQDHPLHLVLYILDDMYLITNWQGQLLEIDPASYQLLFPNI